MARVLGLGLGLATALSVDKMIYNNVSFMNIFRNVGAKI